MHEGHHVGGPPRFPYRHGPGPRGAGRSKREGGSLPYPLADLGDPALNRYSSSRKVDTLPSNGMTASESRDFPPTHDTRVSPSPLSSRSNQGMKAIRTTLPDEGALIPEYRPEIDGLRALAVVAVIIHHFTSQWLPGGYLGVDIFFVISGYVITSSLCTRRETRLVDFLSGFYARRVKRLLPALIVCVVITGCLICLFNRTPGVSLWTGIASLVGLSNLYLFDQATDYFGESAELNVFTQTWSLGVEEQFYLFFPLLLWFAYIRGRGVERLRTLIGLVLLLTCLSLAAFITLSSVNREAVYYLMPMRMWELNTGALVFLVARNLRSVPSRSRSIDYPSMALAGIVCVLFAPTGFGTPATLAVVSLTALLIAVVRPMTWGYHVLCHPAAVYLGRISYSLYLWHWSVISLSRWTIGIHPWTIPVQLGLIGLLAAGSYRYVEKPLRTLDWSSSPATSLRFGIYAAVTAACLLMGLAEPLDGRLYTGRSPHLIASGRATLTHKYSMPDGHSSWQGKGCVLSDNSQVGKLISVDSCTLGAFSTAHHRVLVVGNSFSAAFVQAFDRLVSSDKYSVTITSSWGASPVADIPNEGGWDKANDYYWAVVIPNLISQLKSGDWVFLINDLASFSPDVTSNASDRQLMELARGLSRFSDTLSQRGIRLAVLHGLPFAREAQCDPAVAVGAQWFTPFDSPCHFIPRSRTLARRARLDTMLRQLQSQRKLAIVDLMEVFCPEKTCTYAARNGQTLYRDVHSHPSIEAARLSAPTIRSVLTTGSQGK